MVLELTDDEEILRTPAQPVKTINSEIKQLSLDMIETMYAKRGVGLAAPQVGKPVQLIVYDAGNGPVIMINPKIVGFEGHQSTKEGCLSLPGKLVKVDRDYGVRVRYYNIVGEMKEKEAYGLEANILEHEHDHINGKLIDDYQKE